MFFIFKVFDLLLSFQICSLIKIESSVPFCKKSLETVDFESSCLDEVEFLQKLSCLSALNDLKSGKDQYENEYKFVYAFNVKKIYYYSNNKVFNTICVSINSFEIIENIDKCSRDLSISFSTAEGKIATGYLNKEGIIIENSPTLECKNAPNLFSLNNHFDAIRDNKKWVVKAVDNKLTETKLKTEFENLKESNFLAKLFLYYQKYLQFNESYQVIMNIVLVVLFVAFLIMLIILFSRNKK